jgi:hypothetical protein
MKGDDDEKIGGIFPDGLDVASGPGVCGGQG